MPTQSIQVGVATALTQNVVYAMPARPCYVTAMNAVEVSIDNSTWVAQSSVTNSSPILNGPYVRCTSANTTIVCKPI